MPVDRMGTALLASKPAADAGSTVWAVRTMVGQAATRVRLKDDRLK